MPTIIKVCAQANLPLHVLGELINLFSKISFELTEDKAKDVLGRAYVAEER